MARVEDTRTLSFVGLLLATQESRAHLHRARRRLVEVGLDYREHPTPDGIARVALAQDRVAARIDDLLLYEGVILHRACTGPLGWIVRWALRLR
jgi:hypothetical protein